MDLQKYKKLDSIGSVSLKNVEIVLAQLMTHNMINADTKISELMSLCIDFSKEESKKYKQSKLEQNYGSKERERLDWK